MLRSTSTGIVRPYVPTLADVQRRRAELLGLLPQPQPEQHAQPPEPDPYPPPLPDPAPAAGPPLTSSPAANPKLGEAALHGLAALTVRNEPGAGRSTSLWSAIAEQEQEEDEGSVAEEDQPAAQEEGA
jgi:hypothetical protein